jgi:hypothetical protein
MTRGSYPFTPEEIAKRWQGQGAKMYVDRRDLICVGDILDATSQNGMIRYDHRIRSSFINAPPNPLCRFERGSIHVSVGFNDLSELLSCQLIGDSLKPLLFWGIERSEFSVAKSLVIKEMLLQSEVSFDHILQVWYSASWTKAAMDSFRQACRLVLESAQAFDETISSYLHCWLLDEPISVEESRRMWFKLVENHQRGDIGSSCSFHRLQDRLAILHYLATGELLPSSHVRRSTANPQGPIKKGKKSALPKKTNRPKATSTKVDTEVGSLLFWNVPPNCAPLEADSVFNTISLEVLLEHVSEADDILDAIIQIKLNQLSRLRDRLIKGEMTIELRCAEVAPDNTALVDEICSRGPRTMSWSNCIDYTSYDDFHRMVQAFDATRHYGYSMNWVAMVYGVCLSDYAVDPDPSDTNLLLTEALRKKTHAILTRPCFDTPMNAVGYTLSHKMKGYWVDYFAARGKAKIVAN